MKPALKKFFQIRANRKELVNKAKEKLALKKNLETSEKNRSAQAPGEEEA